MSTLTYTVFPNLYAGQNPCLEEIAPQEAIKCTLDAPLDLLIISWAILLQSYTEEATSVFRVHGQSLAVETLDWISPVVKNVTSVQGYRYTGIFGQDVGLFR